ncbi:LamG-like jellyroll fold domain-containing protein [Streptomyces sp. NBC_01751]|uniref:LamG-like jellyroll fold domain-containing protein n=1 Tax=Streptomyces sp. NBC_01751 TaxID=2975929 RepID=UPI002DDB93F8|nr:hypothetical protein [Streptomyces sp. NBC_01751]WSD23380.1 LamG domain-containing protein [Streptomyces sp. NBC_01751]
MTGFKTHRGRSYELDRMEAGTLSLTLDNSDGRFTPGKRTQGANIFGASQPVSFDLSGRIDNTTVYFRSIVNLTPDGLTRVTSQKVWTDGTPVVCYFAIKWMNNAGTNLRFAIGTRFVADAVPTVYTHEEAPPAGATKADVYVLAESYPDGNASVTFNASDQAWYRSNPYYPNVLPRRRVRVRTANQIPKDVSTGGDITRSSSNFTTFFSAGSSCSWATVPKSGSGSIRVDYGNNGTADFSNSVLCGFAEPAKGLARVQPGATYSAAVQARSGALSKDVSLKTRIQWYDAFLTPISTSAGGPAATVRGERANIVFNGSLTTDLANTQLYGSGLTQARITTDGKFGTSSIEHVYTVAGSAGTTWTTQTYSNGETIKLGMWVKVPAGFTAGQLAWRNGTTTLGVILNQHLNVTVGQWSYISGQYTLKPGETCNRVGIAFTGAVGQKWWADGVTAIADGTLTDYVDGTTPGYHWAGTNGASSTAVDNGNAPWFQASVLNQTAPANAVWAAVEVGTSGASASSGIYVDEIQLEQAATLSEWQPGGSIFHGYIEKWPVKTERLTSSVEVTAVDGFSLLGDVELRTPLQESILASSPLGYWPLTDPQGSTAVQNAAKDKEPARLVASKYGPGTPQFGAASVIARESDSTSYNLANVATNKGTVVDICDNGKRVYPLGFEVSLAFWCHPVYPSAGNTNTLFHSWGDTGNDHMSIQINSAGKVIATMQFVEGITSVTSTVSISSSKPSFLAFTVVDGTISIWINGVLNVTSGIGSVMNDDVRHMRWGSLAGEQGNGSYAEYGNGRYGHLALWDRVLTAAEVADFWQLGDGNGAPYVEDEAKRIARIATYADFLGLQALDGGLSTLLTPSWGEGATALEELQLAASDASGYVFMDGDGRLTFHNRQRRQSAPVRFVLSDSTGTPYDSDLEFEMDEDRIINEIAYKRTGGLEGVIRDDASISTYGRKTKSIELRIASDSEVQDAAYSLQNLYSDPSVRCDQVSLNASAVPALFYVVLGVEVGDRITMAELPDAAPGSSFDFYVEAIDIEVQAEGTVPEWNATLSLSPANQSDVWVLEDPTFGRIDHITVLAY